MCQRHCLGSKVSTSSGLLSKWPTQCRASCNLPTKESFADSALPIFVKSLLPSFGYALMSVKLSS